MIIISPCSAKLRDSDKPNPKNYPTALWVQLVALLRHRRYQTTQIGVSGEERITGTDYFVVDKPLNEIKQMVDNAELFIAVDNFLPHLCNAEKVDTPGIVLVGQGNPVHWGYPQNVNLYKDKKYFRERQFWPWEDAQYIPEAFVPPQEVVWNVDELIKKRAPELLLTAELHAIK